MSFLEDFGDLLPNLVTVRLATGARDQNAVPALGAPASYLGRMVHRRRAMRGRDGEEVVSAGYVRMPYVAGVTTDAEVSVDGAVRLVLAVETGYDEAREPYYTLVRFQ